MDHGISIQLGSTFLQLYRLPQVASSCPLCRSNVAGSTGFHSDIETTWNDIIGTIAMYRNYIVSWVVVSNIFYLPNSLNLDAKSPRACNFSFMGLTTAIFHIKIWNCPIETSIYNMDPHQLPSSRIFPTAKTRQERPEWRTVSLVTCCLSESKLANFFCDVDVEKIFLFVILVIWGVTSGPLSLAVHSPKWKTWNLKNDLVSKFRISFFQGLMFRFHVQLQGWYIPFIFLNTSICLLKDTIKRTLQKSDSHIHRPRGANQEHPRVKKNLTATRCRPSVRLGSYKSPYEKGTSSIHPPPFFGFNMLMFKAFLVYFFGSVFSFNVFFSLVSPSHVW